MQYPTRQLVTLQDMRYEGRVMAPGETFDATEVDARYLIQHRMCEAAPAPAPQAEAVAPQAARRGGRQKASEAPAPQAEAAATTTADSVVMTSADAANGEAKAQE